MSSTFPADDDDAAASRCSSSSSTRGMIITNSPSSSRSLVEQNEKLYATAAMNVDHDYDDHDDMMTMAREKEYVGQEREDVDTAVKRLPSSSSSQGEPPSSGKHTEQEPQGGTQLAHRTSIDILSDKIAEQYRSGRNFASSGSGDDYHDDDDDDDDDFQTVDEEYRVPLETEKFLANRSSTASAAASTTSVPVEEDYAVARRREHRSHRPSRLAAAAATSSEAERNGGTNMAGKPSTAGGAAAAAATSSEAERNGGTNMAGKPSTARRRRNNKEKGVANKVSHRATGMRKLPPGASAQTKAGYKAYANFSSDEEDDMFANSKELAMLNDGLGGGDPSSLTKVHAMTAATNLEGGNAPFVADAAARSSGDGVTGEASGLLSPRANASQTNGTRQPTRRIQNQPRLPGAYHVGVSAPFGASRNRRRRRRGQDQSSSGDGNDQQRLPHGEDIIDDPNDARLQHNADGTPSGIDNDNFGQDGENGNNEAITTVVEIVPEEELEGRFEQRMRAQTVQAKVIGIGDSMIDDETGELIDDAQDQQAQNKRRKRMMIIAGLLILAIITIIIGVVIATSGSGSSGGNGNPAEKPPSTIVDAETESPTTTPTSSPTLSHIGTVKALLASISDIDQLDEEGTPQNRALKWLSDETNESNSNAISAQYSTQELFERYALAVLYYATSGDVSWSNSFGFLSTGISVCEWSGENTGENNDEGNDATPVSVLTCDDSGSVTGIELAGNGLAGELPTELVALTALRRLELSDNNLNGTLPNSYATDLNNLVYMKLARNVELSGTFPIQFLNPPGSGILADIDVSNCNFTGSIRTFLDNFIKRIDLSFNSFSGKLMSINTQARLLELNVRGNAMTGTIPTSFFSQPQLTLLDLSENQLVGTLVPQIRALSGLHTLRLSSNELDGNIATQLGMLVDLKELALDGNNFNGQLPSHIGRLFQLRQLDVSSNAQLSGTIPTELGRLDAIEVINLSQTDIAGPVPTQLGALPQLTTFIAHNTSLTGTGIMESFCSDDDSTLLAKSLTTLQADCDEIACPCCTSCCSDETRFCVAPTTEQVAVSAEGGGN
eukprot:CAMPEP_0119571718 /NCGR_PEP_ID=MMETSP1352-20130426/44259_1 /TAXON_ID=265584 /ORGANISM="Stauroneis constricta, Strain CCMP1120" /LENGTH=1066 /DNA_ID=CAMNT_0007621401 /DNA_START=251 /DNA_END=3452 /DNA_ORIENTATION=-